MASARRSAGVLLYRHRGGTLEVLLVHPGGPFWAKRDEGAWSIPKGEIGEHEDPFAAAEREFVEELGSAPRRRGLAMPLDAVRQKSGKLVLAWAIEGDFDATNVTSNLFEMEWPPKSGRRQSFPEVDRAGWFTVKEARHKLVDGQRPLLAQLEQRLIQ